MAKGLRSKGKRKFRALKRKYVDQTVEEDNLKKLSNRLERIQQGEKVQLDTTQPRNRFLYPESEDAIFPQVKHFRPLDFRNENLVRNVRSKTSELSPMDTDLNDVSEFNNYETIPSDNFDYTHLNGDMTCEVVGNLCSTSETRKQQRIRRKSAKIPVCTNNVKKFQKYSSGATS